MRDRFNEQLEKMHIELIQMGAQCEDAISCAAEALLKQKPELAERAIAVGGNYGEIFAATIGEATPIGLARGLNAQWTQGGLMYAPPFR